MENAIVSSHDQWSPLKEVWIGSCYPESFFNHFDNEKQDIFCRLAEITSKDFSKLKKTLESLDVSVVEPVFTKVDDFMDEQERLLKPPISPCDFAMTLGDTLYINPQYPSLVDPYQHAIDRYIKNQQKIKIIDRFNNDPWSYIIFPSVVRVGRDIFIDFNGSDTMSEKSARQISEILSKEYRVHLSSTGDHSDGVFCPIKPGYIFSTHYRSMYAQSFPGWQVFDIKNKFISPLKGPDHHLKIYQKWYLPGIDFGHFNDLIIDAAAQWLGDPYETVFDVNMLVVDQSHVIGSGENDGSLDFFQDIGINYHLVEFASRLFWDAGIHCVTSDIHRLGNRNDYWPGRGCNGVYEITEW